MRNRSLTIRALLVGGLALLTAGCGDRGASNSAAEQDSGPATSQTAATPEPTSSGGGITVIDAARSDGAAMPADSEAPSAYDRARTAAAKESRSADRAATEAPDSSVTEDEVVAPSPVEAAVSSGG